MEEESFEVRVKRLFGSRLFETVPKSSFPVASWSVADGEVERREWNRGSAGDDDGPDREDNPCSSAFYEEDGCFSKKKYGRSRDRKKDFEDDPEEEELDGGEGGENGEGGSQGGEDKDEDGGGGDGEREEQEIRSSVGLDPTLDQEDEEDEYDRVALCREEAGERLYMRDVKEHGPYLNCHTAVPDLVEESFENHHEFCKDPRADHFAASSRLKEDNKTTEACPLPASNEGPSVDSRVMVCENNAKLKPILKRKDRQIDSKPKKRVRFDSGCIDGHDGLIGKPQDFNAVPESMETTAAEEVDFSLAEELSPRVPDYLQNPSKYTRYSFDSPERDDTEYNKRAYDDFLSLVKKRSNPTQSDLSLELPTTITFVPRKKTSDAMPIEDSTKLMTECSSKESVQISTCSAGVTAGETLENEACEMEEDNEETSVVETSINVRKDRRYRSKSTTLDD